MLHTFSEIFKLDIVCQHNIPDICSMIELEFQHTPKYGKFFLIVDILFVLLIPVK